MMTAVTPVAAGPLDEVKPDLTIPPITGEAPAAGKRVRASLPGYHQTEVHHLLYLPRDWIKGSPYPVIVEYAGNRWKTSPGTVEGSRLGYGISAGDGVIWLCLPFVDRVNGRNATNWWGDLEATVDYCKKATAQVCKDYGGDPEKLFIAGFSRGAIACNFIGLHDDEIAQLWRGFICHSHYDGVRKWNYKGADRAAAATRLARLGTRPQFISHEETVESTRNYLQKAHPDGRFTFVSTTFTEHTDRWVLRDLPERAALRQWFAQALGGD